MKEFAMCPQCSQEYHDPLDRRFHAQPDACHTCGPHLILTDNQGNELLTPHDAESYIAFFTNVAALLAEGMVIAIKGIGGFHLACLATHQQAVESLRRRKFREDKPFAIMCRDIAEIKKYTRVNKLEEIRLLSRERPIVLLAKQEGAAAIAEAVAPGNKCLGIMLPYAPLHWLLFRHIKSPLVMTSANISEEPIACTNRDAQERLNEVCDYFILGNRKIFIRCDDSVTRISNGLDYPLRRSRGIVPAPVMLTTKVKTPILALGAEQKNVICLTRADMAYLSHHIGDLKNLPAFESFKESITHLSRILDTQPGCVAYDLHPGYTASQFIRNLPPEFAYLKELPAVGIQHHHAHIAACMADNGIREPLIGIALDGTGYGLDQTIWGGEIFSVENYNFQREFAFTPVVMPGGEVAIRQPWRMAAAYLYTIYGEQWPAFVPDTWKKISDDEIKITAYQLQNPGLSPVTSSCGRLFDAVAALAGIRLTTNYEGQAAVELEQMVGEETTTGSGYVLESRANELGFRYIKWELMFHALLNDIRDNTPVPVMAARFHYGLAAALVDACRIIRKEKGLTGVVLSGGCFMNIVLLTALCRGLAAGGFTVYTHRQVPCNDGGIALGQVVLADHRTGD